MFIVNLNRGGEVWGGGGRDNIIININLFLATGYVQKFQTDHEGEIKCLCGISDEILATGGEEGVVKLWNIVKNVQLASIKAHVAGVRYISGGKLFRSDLEKNANALKKLLFGRNEKMEDFLITGGGAGDNSIAIWDINEKKEETMRLIGHRDGISSFVLLKDGITLVSGSQDCTVRFWNLTSRKEIKYIKKF